MRPIRNILNAIKISLSRIMISSLMSKLIGFKIEQSVVAAEDGWRMFRNNILGLGLNWCRPLARGKSFLIPKQTSTNLQTRLFSPAFSVMRLVLNLGEFFLPVSS